MSGWSGIRSGDWPADEARSALIIASDQYADPRLRRLRAPASDARALAAVLGDPSIGGFEVRTLLNEPAHVVNLAVEEFFADRHPADLLLVHFSGHGVKDEDGELYFAAPNTVLGRLGATAVAAEFVSRRMNRSRSRRVVLLLDCCYAGAFERGLVARAGNDMGIEQHFGGRGRAVITASSAMEYAFEAGELAVADELSPSVFTSALVEGLETGEADRDLDGLVGLDELYEYVYDRVRTVTPNQTPGKWAFGVQGELYIARRGRPVTVPAPLPPELQQAIDSPLARVRAGAVEELTVFLHGRHPGLALAARLSLEQLAEDDSRAVAANAAAALGPRTPAAPPGSTQPELDTARAADAAALGRTLPAGEVGVDSVGKDAPKAPGIRVGGRFFSRRSVIVAAGVAIAIIGVLIAIIVPGSGPAQPAVRWTYTIPGNASALNSGPAVSGGTVYIGSDNGTVYALDAATGHKRWTQRTGGPISSSPAVAGGVVFIGSADGKVYAMDAATGKIRWTHATGAAVNSSPAVAGGTVYVGSDNGNVYALSEATGKTRWMQDTGAAVNSSPAVAVGAVFIGSDNGRVYAMDAVSGKMLWMHDTGGAVNSSPAVANPTVYVSNDNGNLYALDLATGQVLWSTSSGSYGYSSPAVANDTVYIGSDSGDISAFYESSGQFRWSQPAQYKVSGSPVVAGSIVYISSDGPTTWALDAATGHVVWAYTIGPAEVINGLARPAVAAGTVYVGGAGKVYALSAAS
jgi:outer membrane protein assembly factor BamB